MSADDMLLGPEPCLRCQALDLIDDNQLRILCRRQANQIDRMHTEREAALARMEQTFIRRHNEQRKQIDHLERQLAQLQTRIQEAS